MDQRLYLSFIKIDKSLLNKVDLHSFNRPILKKDQKIVLTLFSWIFFCFGISFGWFDSVDI